MINVLVVDDQKFIHQVIKEHLAKEPDLKIVDFADNGQIAIDKVASLKPDIVLMDIDMPIMDGLTATKIIVEQFLDAKVLILTADDNEQYLNRALQLGAKGYWLKNTTGEELANAIRYVHKGYFQLGLELIEKYLHQFFETKSKLQKKLEDSQHINSEQLNKEQLNNEQLNSMEKEMVEKESDASIPLTLAPKEIAKIIEDMVRKEINALQEQEANVQFKVDRLRQRLNSESQNIKTIFRIQVACLVLIILLIIVVSYYIFLGNR